MANENKVVWSEGMFLRHEHFQQQARHIDYLTSAQIQMLHGHGWGFKTLQIDEQLLRLGKVKLNQCAGIMMDGTLFQGGANCHLPAAVDIPKDTHNCLVYFALPLRGASDVDIDSAEKPDFLSRYRSETVEIQDANVAGMTPTSVILARLRPQLILATQDTSQFSSIAVARIKEVTTNGEVILDEGFMSPCLDARVNPPLKNFLQGLHSLLVNRSKDLSAKLNHPERYEASHMTDFLLMQLLNRYLILTKHWVDDVQLNPQMLYSELLKFSGELTGFSHGQAPLKNLPVYLHDDLQQSFEPLQAFITQALLNILMHRAIQLSLKEQEPGLYYAPVADANVFDDAEIVIAVKADLPTDALKHSFANQVKVAPIELMENLVSLQLPGIPSDVLPVAPVQVPYHAGYHYFSLQKNDRRYAALKEASGVAVHIGGDIPQLQLEIWLIKKNEGVG